MPQQNHHQLKIRVREYDEEPSRERERGKVADNFHEYVVVTTKTATTAAAASEDASSSSNAVNVTQLESNRRRRWMLAPARVVQELFLPVGFPTSVAPGYLEYQLYDSVQGLCSYLRGVLCSAQVLQAAGVGKAEATALSAATTWALKDGVSMLGGLFFSYTSAPLFDSHVKEFRLFADLINDVGLTLDMVAPYFEGRLLLVASAAGLCKTLCGISAGATKGSITLHFANEGNMADLNAKESTQETLVSLIGMLLGIALANKLQTLEEEGAHNADLIVQMQWFIFTTLTVVHVVANWKGVRVLRMRTLNRERAEIVLDGVLNELQKVGNANSDSKKCAVGLHGAVRGLLPSPNEVNESLVASTRKMLWPGRLRLKAHLTEVLECDVEATSIFKDEHYILNLNTSGEVLVSLMTGSTPEDQLKAFLQALYLIRQQRSASSMKDIGERRKRIRESLELVNLLFDSSTAPVSLMAELKRKGWEVEERLYLGFSRRRSHWTTDKVD